MGKRQTTITAAASSGTKDKEVAPMIITMHPIRLTGTDVFYSPTDRRTEDYVTGRFG